MSIVESPRSTSRSASRAAPSTRGRARQASAPGGGVRGRDRDADRPARGDQLFTVYEPPLDPPPSRHRRRAARVGIGHPDHFDAGLAAIGGYVALTEVADADHPPLPDRSRPIARCSLPILALRDPPGHQSHHRTGVRLAPRILMDGDDSPLALDRGVVMRLVGRESDEVTRGRVRRLEPNANVTRPSIAIACSITPGPWLSESRRTPSSIAMT